MINNNALKKKSIDGILAKYNARMAVLRQKRNKIISDSLDALKEKKLKELRSLIKKI